MAEIKLADAPEIRGLSFRNYSGEEDIPGLHAVSEKEKHATGDDYFESLPDFKNYYRNLVNCDPAKDLLIAEIDGITIAYSRVWWSRKQMGGYNYNHFVILDPDWYGKGIRNAMIIWNETRLREIAVEHPDAETKEFQAWALDTEEDWLSLLMAQDYRIARYGFSMVRSLDIGIPEIPLLEGLEVRRITPDDYRKVWDADIEASKDGWQPIEIAEEFYNMWLGASYFQPDIWAVAWDGDDVAGAVQNFINHEENDQYGRKRGYTENIHVGRKWRGKGLAKALIARSFRILKEQGMEQAGLGVDAENPTGALHVYRSMGFEVEKTFHTYRKTL